MTEQPTRSNNRRIMYILAVVFILPVVLAKLALEQGWFEQAATNKGVLLTPSLLISDLGQPAEGKWRIFYVVPSNCEVPCQNALMSLNQVWKALGKNMDRAEALAYLSDESDERVINQLNGLKNINIVNVGVENVNELFKGAASDGIFLVDTLGNVILRYPMQNDPQQAVLHSRDILSDMRKLMKLSRIG